VTPSRPVESGFDGFVMFADLDVDFLEFRHFVLLVDRYLVALQTVQSIEVEQVYNFVVHFFDRHNLEWNDD